MTTGPALAVCLVVLVAGCTLGTSQAVGGGPGGDIDDGGDALLAQAGARARRGRRDDDR